MDEYVGTEMNDLMKAITALAELPEEVLQGEPLEALKKQMAINFSPEIKEQSINQVVLNMENQRLTREEAVAAIDAVKEVLMDVVHIEEFSQTKQEALKALFEPLMEVFEAAKTRYHLYNITLPIKLEEGAKVPSYAHDSDAAADLYALEDTDLNAHTYGNKIRTGVSIQLPEGWLAFILPRSSIGAKTPFRLSNSVGLIDSGYRGELGVLYDNTSDQNMYIKAGDRIAQLLVMPSYRFMPQVVESLEDSDRGEGGFGSTGA